MLVNNKTTTVKVTLPFINILLQKIAISFFFKYQSVNAEHGNHNIDQKIPNTLP